MISKRSLSTDNVRERRGGNRSKNNSAHVGRRCLRILLRKENHRWTTALVLVATTLLGLYWHLAVESFRNHNADSAAVAAAHHPNNHKRPFQDGDSSSEGAQQVVLSNDNVGSVRRATTQQQNQPRPRPTTEQVVWILETALGRLRIVLRPDLSPESVAYVQAVVRSTTDETKGGCPLCRFYRAEKPGIFQGILPSETVPLPAVHGNCPYHRNPNDTTNQKESNDSCHGPIMTRGMVGWAGGLLGPDFFIDSYPRPAEWWGTQHTVFGEIKDDASFQLLDLVYEKPTRDQAGMHMLVDPIKFTMRLETQSAEAEQRQL